ncbi:Metallo-dependent phosphatase [Macrophomina phaseolina MS6]|uniref:Inositol-1-monophosphatase n=1 Tax=Macrophomina phaseolina (strain MS6) TaxID=1126212 RepID=K2REQ7_MACPH|nr:Metallo-dependent phosphatase [Macrophomina phaseolina MS6]
MSFSIEELEDIRDYLVGVAREAGEMIASAEPTKISVELKKNTTDIVTETDKAVENLIATRLIARYPEYDFIGEESFKPRPAGGGGSSISDAPSFIVDPIDGTSNFLHGFPSVCVALGFAVRRAPVVGVVLNPFTDELWSAVRSRGAFYQRGADRKPHVLPFNVGPLTGLEYACVGVDWGCDREGPNFELNLRVFATLARSKAAGGRCVNALRCTGSAAETICRVAAGQQDAFWECGCFPWDVAAAWCVLSEAGGMLVDAHPGGWDPSIENERFLAIRPAVTGQKEFVEEFWSVVGDGRSTYGP